MAKPVIALVGDIVGSKALDGPERLDLNARLDRCMATLNRRGAPILSPYTLTLGDEIQAVFARAEGLFRDATEILTAIYPRRMRFSFGVDRLVTPINPERAIGMDGPAFHRARDGVATLKGSGHLFKLSGAVLPYPALLNHALDLASHSVQDWRHTRWLTFSLLWARKPAQEIAGQIGVTDKAVYKNIQAGALSELIGLLTEIETTVDEAMEGIADE